VEIISGVNVSSGCSASEPNFHIIHHFWNTFSNPFKSRSRFPQNSDIFSCTFHPSCAVSVLENLALSLSRKTSVKFSGLPLTLHENTLLHCLRSLQQVSWVLFTGEVAALPFFGEKVIRRIFHIRQIVV